MTYLMWSRSRMRRGSGNDNVLLLTSGEVDQILAGLDTQDRRTIVGGLTAPQWAPI
jgi:hypothetical protein